MAIYNGKHYDPDFLCQDDYEWLTETGPYAHTRVAIIRRGLSKRRDTVLAARKRTSRSLLQAYQHSPRSVIVPTLEAVRDAFNEQIATLDFRLALLDTSPRVGYYTLPLDALLSIVAPHTRHVILKWLVLPWTLGELLEGEQHATLILQELALFGVLRGEGAMLDLFPGDLKATPWAPSY